MTNRRPPLLSALLRHAGLSCVAALLLACSGLGLSGGDAGPDADLGSPDADADASPDARDAAGLDAGDLGELDGADFAGFRLPAASGSYAVDFTVGIEGSGHDFVGDVSLADGFGTAVIDGESLPIAIHERQNWEDFGYTLYQGLAVAPDRWFLLWFYCQAGDLAFIYFEGTDGTPIAYETASGSCDESDAPSTVDVSFPEVAMPVPELLDGFTMTGSDVGLDGAAPGWVRVGETTFDVYAFSHVDCSVDCGTPGWHELHALLWDPERAWLCVGIFYLFVEARPILLTYTFSLPALVEPFGAAELTDTAWSGP